MHIKRTARAASIAILATVLFAGCATAEPSAPATNEPSASDEQTPQTTPEQRQVEVLEVIDPVAVVVTPADEADELYGTEFEVHISEFVTPAEGECGYDEALAFAEETLVENPWFLQYSPEDNGEWINADGDHKGSLSSRGPTYGQRIVSAGFAHLVVDAEPGYLTGNQADAESNSVGLWATCPDFGA